MKNEEKFYKELIENLKEGIYYVDNERRITFWNKAAERITGYKKSEVLNKRCMDNILCHIDHNGCNLCLEGCPLTSVMKDGRTKEIEVFLHHKDGHRVPVTVRGTALYAEDGSIAGAVEIFSDNSVRENLLIEMEKLKKRVLIDPLTQIGNRSLAELTFNSRFDDYKQSGVTFCVVLMDIDHFKSFNDIYGHNVGDMVLKMVAKTVSNTVRKLDTVIRWGGEEFLVIIPNIDDEQFKNLAERIRIFIEKSWLSFNDKALKVTVSVGGTTVAKDDTMVTLVERADSNMYDCKESGRNCVKLD